MEKLKAFWVYAEKNNQAFLNKFLAEYTGEKSTQNQEAQNQEAPAQETQQQSLPDLDFINDPDLDFLVDSNSPLFDDSDSPLLNYLNDYFK